MQNLGAGNRQRVTSVQHPRNARRTKQHAAVKTFHRSTAFSIVYAETRIRTNFSHRDAFPPTFTPPYRNRPLLANSAFFRPTFIPIFFFLLPYSIYESNYSCYRVKHEARLNTCSSLFLPLCRFNAKMFETFD